MVTHAGTHVTVYASLQMLGLGREGDRVRRIAADDQGRMRPDALREALAAIDGPTIVCAQAGNVNSGAFDPFEEIVADRPRARRLGAHRRRVRDLGRGRPLAPPPHARPRDADSWSTDAHKWLNVPYDSGLVFVRDAGRPPRRDDARRRLLRRDRRRRARPLQLGARSRRAGPAASRSSPRSGRSGGPALVDLIERDCALARRMADALAAGPRVAILNDVVLNQVLVRFEADGTTEG